MCDYSLDGVASRPARIGDRIVSTRFATSFTRGFGFAGARDIAACLPPGTEVVFDGDVEVDAALLRLPARKIGEVVARFRRVNADRPTLPHDALEFANGEIALVMHLAEGQAATVIQLPVSGGGTARAARKKQLA